MVTTPNEIISWPDGSTEPLTPELGAALVAIVRVFGGECRCEGSRPTKDVTTRRVWWQRQSVSQGEPGQESDE